MKAGILGYGEIGKAIASFYKDPKIRDLNRDDGFSDIDVLHVCIPYIKKFKTIVIKTVREAKIRNLIVIIHSTVPPGTTKDIAEALFMVTPLVVHSPVRGVHPDLKKGIKTFVKFIGAQHRQAGVEAKKVFDSIGIKAEIFMPAISTEMAKVFSTTYYSMCIEWHREMDRVCKKHDIDFETITAWNETYNSGYEELGSKQYARPCLYPPPKKGIAGHCCLENAILLREHTDVNKDFIDRILSLGKHPDSISESRSILNRTWLYCEYWGKGKTASDIAKESGLSTKSVMAVMKKLDIPIRDQEWAVSRFSKWFSWIKDKD